MNILAQGVVAHATNVTNAFGVSVSSSATVGTGCVTITTKLSNGTPLSLTIGGAVATAEVGNGYVSVGGDLKAGFVLLTYNNVPVIAPIVDGKITGTLVGFKWEADSKGTITISKDGKELTSFNPIGATINCLASLFPDDAVDDGLAEIGEKLGLNKQDGKYLPLDIAIAKTIASKTTPVIIADIKDDMKYRYFYPFSGEKGSLTSKVTIAPQHIMNFPRDFQFDESSGFLKSGKITSYDFLPPRDKKTNVSITDYCNEVSLGLPLVANFFKLNLPHLSNQFESLTNKHLHCHIIWRTPLITPTDVKQKIYWTRNPEIYVETFVMPNHFPGEHIRLDSSDGNFIVDKINPSPSENKNKFSLEILPKPGEEVPDTFTGTLTFTYAYGNSFTNVSSIIDVKYVRPEIEFNGSKENSQKIDIYYAAGYSFYRSFPFEVHYSEDPNEKTATEDELNHYFYLTGDEVAQWYPRNVFIQGSFDQEQETDLTNFKLNYSYGDEKYNKYAANPIDVNIWWHYEKPLISGDNLAIEYSLGTPVNQSISASVYFENYDLMIVGMPELEEELPLSSLTIKSLQYVPDGISIVLNNGVIQIAGTIESEFDPDDGKLGNNTTIILGYPHADDKEINISWSLLESHIYVEPTEDIKYNLTEQFTKTINFEVKSLDENFEVDWDNFSYNLQGNGYITNFKHELVKLENNKGQINISGEIHNVTNFVVSETIPFKGDGNISDTTRYTNRISDIELPLTLRYSGMKDTVYNVKLIFNGYYLQVSGHTNPNSELRNGLYTVTDITSNQIHAHKTILTDSITSIALEDIKFSNDEEMGHHLMYDSWVSLGNNDFFENESADDPNTPELEQKYEYSGAMTWPTKTNGLNFSLFKDGSTFKGTSSYRKRNSENNWIDVNDTITFTLKSKDSL